MSVIKALKVYDEAWRARDAARRAFDEALMARDEAGEAYIEARGGAGCP